MAAHAWIVAVAVGAAALGVLGGRLWATHAAVAPAPDDSYAEQLIATYGLSRQQGWSLRLVLAADRASEDEIRRALKTHELPQELQARLLHARHLTRERIRALLDDEQRQRYDRDSQPVGTDPAAQRR